MIAAATALPELSTGFAAVKLGDYQLAMSDIFGGNGFMPVLFVVADLIAGTPALAAAQPSDIWLAASSLSIIGIHHRYGRGIIRLSVPSRATKGA